MCIAPTAKNYEGSRRDAQRKGSRSICIGVTVLTNLNAQDLQQFYGAAVDVGTTVEAMAAAVSNAGLQGIVCSAQEAAAIKQRFGKDFITVCPGVRPAFTQSGSYAQNRKEDQARVMTAYEAVKTELIICGRPPDYPTSRSRSGCARGFGGN